jgi:hypothetical protein
MVERESFFKQESEPRENYSIVLKFATPKMAENFLNIINQIQINQASTEIKESIDALRYICSAQINQDKSNEILLKVFLSPNEIIYDFPKFIEKFFTKYRDINTNNIKLPQIYLCEDFPVKNWTSSFEEPNRIL